VRLLLGLPFALLFFRGLLAATGDPAPSLGLAGLGWTARRPSAPMSSRCIALRPVRAPDAASVTKIQRRPSAIEGAPRRPFQRGERRHRIAEPVDRTD
jgi:hypothetical protein